MVRAERSVAASTKELELLSVRLKHEVQQRVAVEGIAITVAPSRHNLYPKDGNGLFDPLTTNDPAARCLHSGEHLSESGGEGCGAACTRKANMAHEALVAAETRAAEAESALRELQRTLLEREVITASLQLQVQERDHQVRRSPLYRDSGSNFWVVVAEKVVTEHAAPFGNTPTCVSVLHTRLKSVGLFFQAHVLEARTKATEDKAAAFDVIVAEKEASLQSTTAALNAKAADLEAALAHAGVLQGEASASTAAATAAAAKAAAGAAEAAARHTKDEEAIRTAREAADGFAAELAGAAARTVAAEAATAEVVAEFEEMEEHVRWLGEAFAATGGCLGSAEAETGKREHLLAVLDACTDHLTVCVSAACVSLMPYNFVSVCGRDPSQCHC
jgi:hypothetical protein